MQQFEIFPLPALRDNYIWTIIDADSQTAIVVDPSEAAPVIDLLTQKELNLSAVLITHHHYDHTGGIFELYEWQQSPVYGAAINESLGITHAVPSAQGLQFPQHHLRLNHMAIPGHTLDHTAYYNNHLVFTGDMLFSAGCGRVFEGTYEQMFQSLQKIAALADETAIYCGHEYTVKNLEFAQVVDPKNEFVKHHLSKARHLRAQQQPTLPSTIGQEKRINPFLKCEEKDFIAIVESHAGKKLSTPVQVFQFLRDWKDQF